MSNPKDEASYSSENDIPQKTKRERFTSATHKLLGNISRELSAFQEKNEEEPQDKIEIESPSQKNLLSASKDFLKSVSREMLSISSLQSLVPQKKLQPAPRKTKLKILYTVDTEFWPDDFDLSSDAITAAMNRDIYGKTAKEDLGLPMQIKILNHYGLKGSFFVEALSASVVGLEPLEEIVSMLKKGKQEVQLHVHPEWADKSTRPIFYGRAGTNMHQFTEEEQFQLLELGLANLAMCGSPNINAFRAGNYGAGNSTLRALSRHGIDFDTSYNFCYLDSACAIRTDSTVIQPQKMEGLIQVPVNFFEDWPGHYRHTQLCACSFEELSDAMLKAYDAGWYSFVIVSHSFELLNPYRNGPDFNMVQRFKKLCQFINQNKDKFEMVGFLDLDPQHVPTNLEVSSIESSAVNTLQRVGEQTLRRMTSGSFSQVSYDLLERFSGDGHDSFKEESSKEEL